MKGSTDTRFKSDQGDFERSKEEYRVRKPSASEVQVHGTMVEVNGVGVLLMGDSGVGKSEAALELISRGHKLIADDAVVIRNNGDAGLEGSANPVIANLLEIRGLGIINVPDLFGSTSVAPKAKISLCVFLSNGEELSDEPWLDSAIKSESLAGVEVPKFEIPVKSGRNIPVLLETAVRIVAANNKTDAAKVQ